MRSLSKMKRTEEKGFTLVELMIVIAIIGILASIAVPNFVSYRKRAYNASANADAANAYRAYTAFRSAHPDTTASIASLESYGFRKSKDVSIGIIFAGSPDYPYIWCYHPQGTKYFWVIPDGRVYSYYL